MNELDFTIKEAVNEPIKEYTPGSSEKASLKAKLEELKSKTFDIPSFPESISKVFSNKCVLLG